MDKDIILSILETIPKHILIYCAEKLFLKNKKITSLEKSPNTSSVIKMEHYDNTKVFIKDLINCYEVMLDLIKINGDSGIVNKKRKETYQKAIEFVKGVDTSVDIQTFIKKISTGLTEKPKKIMKELFANGEVTLEDKSPYNGATIKNGKVVGAEEEIEAFKNLSVLVGIGIGLGDAGVKDLVRMGYTSIDELRLLYEKDKFESFRKGLQGPLRKYFEGTVRIEKMSREEATKWRDTISEIVEKVISEIDDDEIIIKHKIGGSYARKKEEIGDIDYVVVVNDKKDQSKANITLYNLMNNVLDLITEVNDIGNLLVELDSVTETPSKPIKGKRYSTSIKLWFKVGKLKTKVEIYGYSNTDFVFPYFARSAEVNLQKKVKMQALRNGYKLSPWSLDLKDTDMSIETVPEQVELIRQKLGKDKIETIKELFEFLDYSSGNN
jgi:predicted nucleotidyltransferase